MVVEPNKELTDVTNMTSGLPVGLCVGVTNIRLGNGGFIKVSKKPRKPSPQKLFLVGSV